MIDRTSPIPLYFQLAELVRSRIAAGELTSGDKLPSEQELCAGYGVSRSVVRQALASLSRDGLIATERGRGAFVRDRKVPLAFTTRLDPLREGMARAGFKLTTKVLAQRLIDAPLRVADEIGDPRAVYIERLRFADGQVLLFVENYMPYSRIPGLLEFGGLETASLYDFLEESAGIVPTTGRRVVEVARCRPDVAAHLGVEPGSHTLFNRETTFDQHGRAIEYYESWHHPDRTRLTIDLYRQSD